MEASNNTGADASPAQRLERALPGLVHALRRGGWDVGTEQYLAVCDLIVSFAAQGRQPAAAELRAALAGVFCTSADEQARFPEIFNPWYARLGFEAERAASTKPVAATRQASTWLNLQRVGRVRVWSGAAVIAVLAAALLTYSLWPPVEAPTVQAPEVEIQPAAKAPSAGPAAAQRPQPRQPPEPVMPPPVYNPVWVQPLRLAWLAPVFLWLLWFAHRILLRHVVLKRRRQQPGEEIRLDHLHLAGDRDGPFDAPALADTWRHLRQFRSMRTRHLNEAATVDRTLESGGYFRPVYRERQVPPAYLLLVDRRHGEDHAAAMAAELQGAMRRESIQVSVFDYYEDPRYCLPTGQAASERGPAALAGVYADRDVLMVGDGDALFDPGTGTAQPWLWDFTPFAGRLLLTFEPVWRQGGRAQDLAQAGFRLLPLTIPGLAQIGETEGDVGVDDPRDWPTPRRFAVDPGRWLEERPLGRARLKAVLQDLEDYLGQDGFLLLSATAAYPGLYWGLTRALDAQLALTATERGLRLRKLARLPWYRHARMPNYLRLALLRGLPRGRFRRVTDAYAALLEHRKDRPLRLPVAVPKWKGMAAALREFLQGVERYQPLGDRVFASVVRGRRPRLLEFALPARLAWRLPAPQWRGLVLPLLSGLLLAPAAIWLNVWLWQSWGEAAAQREALASMTESHQQTRARVVAGEELALIAESLQTALRKWGFEVSDPEAEASTRQQDTRAVEEKGANQAPNRVIYAPGARAQARQIANRVSYLYYGVAPDLVEGGRSALPAETDVLVELRAAPRGFRDLFVVAPIEPEMVSVIGGKFQMGDLQGDGAADERPVRTVSIRPFASGRHEVTFEEYDRFAEATGRELPDDQGWGRGRRPVINVSWDDAVAYAEWLSAQTGKRYRLPTEAEWEYAARAGTETTYWWGDEVGENRANCRGCGSQWDGKQTAPVGSFEPNPFGLYDTAGNVYEWVQDCWHDSYEGAPTDGSAREEEGCSRRVIRGGSWYYLPWNVRSADRYWDAPGLRFGIVGFRLAQDIK